MTHVKKLLIALLITGSLYTPQRTQGSVLLGTLGIALAADTRNRGLEIAGIIAGTAVVLTGIALSTFLFVSPEIPGNAIIGAAILVLDTHAKAIQETLPFLDSTEVQAIDQLAAKKRAAGQVPLVFTKEEVEGILSQGVGEYTEEQVATVLRELGITSAISNVNTAAENAGKRVQENA